MKTLINDRRWPTLFLIILALWTVSCGKKGPPVPPRAVPPPAVPRLSMELEGDELTLIWTAPEGSRRMISDLGGFLIYRSKQSLSAPECKDCPILFTRIATVPYAGQTPGTERITYSETLEKGFRYIYKVTVFSKSGIERPHTYANRIREQRGGDRLVAMRLHILLGTTHVRRRGGR